MLPVHFLKIECILFKNKANQMQTRRRNALADLARLAETLRNHKMVAPHLTLIEEMDFIYTWANTDGTKSCLHEINQQIDAIKLKVREQFFLS